MILFSGYSSSDESVFPGEALSTDHSSNEDISESECVEAPQKKNLVSL